MRYVVVAVLVGLMPLVSQAAVTINEIAWMGDSVSANHEWIELFNDGGAVNVDGWSLSDGDSINISLSGTISANGFVVLERTSDESAPGTAFLIYTGALKNSGVTLTLRRPDNGIEDQVTGGEDWANLGGDNVTKATAQYTESGWTTAEPTPGSSNTNSPAPVETRSGSTGSAKLAEPVERESEKLVLPGVTLELDIVAPTQTYVNQVTPFDVLPSGVGDTIAKSLNYNWNFGDINVSEQKSPEHIFTYPGKYVVHLSAEYGRQHAYATKEVTVLPVALSLTKNSQGDIQINNDSPYELDLSGYRLRAGKAFDMPDNTWLLSRQTITLPKSQIKASNQQLIALYDNTGKLVTSIKPPHLETKRFAGSQVSGVSNSYTTKVPAIQPAEPGFQFVSEIRAESIEEVAAEPEPVLQNTEFTESTPKPTKSRIDWTLVALVVLLSLGCIVVLMKPQSNRMFEEN